MTFFFCHATLRPNVNFDHKISEFNRHIAMKFAEYIHITKVIKPLILITHDIYFHAINF